MTAASEFVIEQAIGLVEQAKPTANPAPGQLDLYAKSDHNIYTLNSSGVETLVGSSGGGSKAFSYYM